MSELFTKDQVSVIVLFSLHDRMDLTMHQMRSKANKILKERQIAKKKDEKHIAKIKI